VVNFQRTIEDFKCENCGREVVGNGYTNHCPSCCVSKHVDVNPGDRQALNSCGGLMFPISIEMKSGECVILHKCQKCGHMKKNKAGKGDDISNLIKILKSPIL